MNKIRCALGVFLVAGAMTKTQSAPLQAAPLSSPTNVSSANASSANASAAQQEDDAAIALRLTKAERARFDAEQKISASRLKTLARAALDFAHAHNDRFDISARNFAPQLKTVEKISFPTDGYAFNRNLFRVWMLEIQEPEKIVLFYEGANRKLRFRATGWSVVAFADGSVRSVTRSQARNLRWWKDRVLDEAEDAPKLSELDQSSPEATARSFVQALNSERFDLARQCIAGAKPLPQTRLLQPEARADTTKIAVGQTAVKTKENQAEERKAEERKAEENFDSALGVPDDEAVATILYSPKKPAAWDAARFALDIEKFEAQEIADGFSLGNYRVKLGQSTFFNGGQSAFVFDSAQKVWRIAPISALSLASQTAPHENERKSNSAHSGVLAMFAAYVLDDKAAPAASVFASVLETLRVESTNRLKQISVGAMQFVQEYDEVYDFDTDNFGQKMQPYVQNKELFLSPFSSQPYSLNPAMAKRNLSSIATPSQTVLFYEGSAGVLDYCYNGRANIAFADGHVASATPQQAAQLMWNPPIMAVENAPPTPIVVPELAPEDFEDDAE